MQITMADIEYIGAGLDRPESVLATSSGKIFSSDHIAGVTAIGSTKVPLQCVPKGFMPNGIAMLPNHEFLIANLGIDGGVWRIDGDHKLHPFLLEADGQSLSITNFVGLDDAKRMWVSVSTRQIPRERAFRKDIADGFVVLMDSYGARIVADGLGFTNECRVDPTGRWLYVNETFSRRLSRFEILNLDSRITLGPKEIVYTFSDGDFPDGLTFDAESGVWVACVVSNRVVRITSNGNREVILDAADPAITKIVDDRWRQEGLGRADIALGGESPLRNVSSIAFGGADLKTVYLGCLAGDRIATFRTTIQGARPAHWNFDT